MTEDPNFTENQPPKLETTITLPGGVEMRVVSEAFPNRTNEDYFGYCQKSGVLVVADGVPKGDNSVNNAARIVTHEIIGTRIQFPENGGVTGKMFWLKNRVEEAHKQLIRLNSGFRGEQQSRYAAVTALAINQEEGEPNSVVFAFLGNVRVGALDINNKIHWAFPGDIDPESPNTLTSYAGNPNKGQEFNLGSIVLCSGDRVIVATGGYYNHRRTGDSFSDLHESAKGARKRTGDDITVMILEVPEKEGTAESPVDENGRAYRRVVLLKN